ncbi:hypothetical protein KACC15558_07790 [Brevibacterium ammoniilyticum]|uniref:Uncharacterized protein n=1 Tax=Brevibacterium ammoniilyticum TaxID=1046555 RepID=A0ABP9U0C1_9MICO
MSPPPLPFDPRRFDVDFEPDSGREPDIDPVAGLDFESDAGRESRVESESVFDRESAVDSRSVFGSGSSSLPKSRGVTGAMSPRRSAS